MKKITTLFLAALLFGCGKPQSEFDAVASKLSAEQQKSAALAATVSTLEAELKSAQSKIEELAPLAKKARTLPIQITKENLTPATSFLEPNPAKVYAYSFLNLSPNILPIKVTISNPSYQTKKTFEKPIEPMKPTYFIKISEWKPSPGDTIEVSSSGYDSATKTFD